jgi:hypothetical protein
LGLRGGQKHICRDWPNSVSVRYRAAKPGGLTPRKRVWNPIHLRHPSDLHAEDIEPHSIR